MGRREQYQYASPCDDVTNRPARTASSRLPPPPAPPAPSPSTGYGTTSARSGITLCNMCNSFSVYFGLRKRSNSVQLYRLDFDNLVTASPPTTGENLGKLAKELLIKNIYSSIVFRRLLRRRQRLCDRGEPERLEPSRRLRPALGAAQ